MSEKEKKNAPQEEQPQANTTPETEQAAEKAAEEETFTVTREQMEQMEQLAKMVSDASDKYLRLAWVVLGLMGGSGLLAYIIASIVIPVNPDQQ